MREESFLRWANRTRMTFPTNPLITAVCLLLFGAATIGTGPAFFLIGYLLEVPRMPELPKAKVRL